jgi:hypothetical protein
LVFVTIFKSCPITFMAAAVVQPVNTVMGDVKAEEPTQDSFPIIDYSTIQDDPRGTALKVFDAASRWGFLVLQGHGIPDEELDAMWAMVSGFNSSSKPRRD